MSSSGDVLCFCHPLLRGSPVAGVRVQGQTVPERVGSGDTRRTGGCGGGGKRTGLRPAPTGKSNNNNMPSKTSDAAHPASRKETLAVSVYMLCMIRPLNWKLIPFMTA